MQQLSLTKRPGQLKGSIATRPELHGDETIPALTVSIGGILLFAKDLIAMYNNEDAHNRLFTSAGGAGLVPAFPGSLIYITEVFKGAKVTLKTVNMDEPMILKPATVKDIWLEPQDAGGLVAMSCKILGAPSDDARINPLHMVNQKCTIAILNGKLAGKEENENQAELPLDEGGGPAPDGMTDEEREEAEATRAAIGDDDEPSSMARKIGRAEAKKKRSNRKTH